MSSSGEESDTVSYYKPTNYLRIEQRRFEENFQIERFIGSGTFGCVFECSLVCQSNAIENFALKFSKLINSKPYYEYSDAINNQLSHNSNIVFHTLCRLYTFKRKRVYKYHNKYYTKFRLVRKSLRRKRDHALDKAFDFYIEKLLVITEFENLFENSDIDEIINVCSDYPVIVDITKSLQEFYDENKSKINEDAGIVKKYLNSEISVPDSGLYFQKLLRRGKIADMIDNITNKIKSIIVDIIRSYETSFKDIIPHIINEESNHISVLKRLYVFMNYMNIYNYCDESGTKEVTNLIPFLSKEVKNVIKFVHAWKEDIGKNVQLIFVQMYRYSCDLFKYNNTKLLTDHEKNFILMSVLNGYREMNKVNMLHGDIKSNNILLNINKNGYIVDVVITDFGTNSFINKDKEDQKSISEKRFKKEKKDCRGFLELWANLFTEYDKNDETSKGFDYYESLLKVHDDFCSKRLFNWTVGINKLIDVVKTQDRYCIYPLLLQEELRESLRKQKELRYENANLKHQLLFE